MKKLYSIVALALLVCTLCACGQKTVKEPDMQTVSEKVAASFEAGDLSPIPDTYVESIMGITADGYKSFDAHISAIGIVIDEYGIFLANDADQADELKAALDKYIEYRRDAWMDEYLPDEKYKLDNAEVWKQGNFVMYAILSDDDRAAAKQAFESCFEG